MKPENPLNIKSLVVSKRKCFFYGGCAVLLFSSHYDLSAKPLTQIHHAK